MADMEFAGDYGRAPRTGHAHFGHLVNWAGAAMSVALLIGVGTWGYKLMVRDVNGIPVVAAVDGPMRVQPDNPGGLQAAHQGLAVNHVPRPVDVTETDQPGLAAPVEPSVQSMAEAEDASLAAVEAAAQPVAMMGAQTPALQVPDVQAAADAAVAQLLEDTPALSELTPAEGPGLARSDRPSVRPDRAGVEVASAEATTPVLPASIDVDAASVPSGTRLVQLGAFDSPETARSEWDRITTRFEGYLDGKQRVIQRAESGGRTFYRLRAMGFADLSDARRFCSALVAENAACIPVVVR